MTRVLFSLAIFGLLLYLPHRAQAQDAAKPGSDASQQMLQGNIDIVFNVKFPTEEKDIIRAAVLPGQGYASVRYAIGASTEKEYIQQVLDYMAQTLPAAFGNTSGTYVITLTISDLGGKLLAKEPIVSFTWTKERGFLFFDHTVNEVRKTSWKGTVINQMMVSPANDRLKVSLEVLLQQNRSLDFDLMKKTAKTFTAGAMASYLALPAATLPFIDAVTGLINDLYSGSVKKSLVDEDELMVAPANPAKRAPITFVDGQGRKFVVPVLITIDTQESRLIPGGFANGKFDKSKLSEALFSTAQIAVAEGKPVNLIELISTSSDARYKQTRAMLDAVMSGGNFGKDPAKEDVARRCGDLYDALNSYLSIYDARVMFWAFLKRHGERLDKKVCLGNRESELTAVGLDF